MEKTTPRDFFLWFGAVIALYGSIAALITLLFEYINYVFPDPLAYYADPYGGAIRFSMATLIVLTPTALMLLHLIRKALMREPSRAQVWIRRWALMLTLFIAGTTILIDLITLINTFLGGEITVRFALKVAVVLLIAFGVALHFLADLRGYWILHPRRATLIGLASGLLVLLTVVAGFFIVGSPHQMRLFRYDEQKTSDLQTIQYEIVNYWQQKEALPKSLNELVTPMTGFVVPSDPQTGTSYRYETTGDLAFKLCSTFNLPSRDLEGRGGYPMHDTSYPGMPMSDNWEHGTGETCFDRTIDPDFYPPYEKAQ
ncbi:MAG TPA: DUF5671 domain-containing protein [Candidatus Paceibacterota bacterium]|jgi:hypothetical protein